MPSRRFYVNFAPVQNISPGISSSATTLTVTSFSGWPVQYPFFATLDYGTSTAEIVSVTNIAGNVATVIRGQGGTTAVAHVAGATIDMTAVAQDLDEANAHTSANSGVHGVAGNVVGTTDVQTLTNKTFSGTTTLATVNAGAVSVTSLSNSGATAVSGASTAASFTANGDGVISGVVKSKTYANEAAAAAAQTTGNIVYLSAPTTAGHTAGLYMWNGAAWQPAVTDSGWTVLTFSNSWVSYDGGASQETPMYRLLNGVVYVKGLMKLGSAGLTAFTLPAGYRPTKRRKFIAAANGGTCELNLLTDGTVVPNGYTSGATNAYVSLDTMTFIAEQ